MRRMIALALPALLFLTGCASTQRLTQHSERDLAQGDSWRAWQLATRALDKAPANPRARAAATAAGASISLDWSRRIRALAASDSLAAADQVMEFVSFRENAARYVTIPVDLGWPEEERTLRLTAARVHYRRGVQALAAHRPKQAHGHLADCERFVPDYRDAGTLADRAMAKAVTRVAILPLGGAEGLGKDVADRWREDVTKSLEAHAQYTRVQPASAVDPWMTVSQLDGLTRDEALALGRKAGAQRVVWGTVGNVDSKTHLEFFRDMVWRRDRETDSHGSTVTRWTAVPIEVLGRRRDVTVHASYELIDTRDGAALAQQAFDRTTSARVLWTDYQPGEDLDAYALVTDAMRASDPDRARGIEARWKDVCGDATLRQVLEARAASHGHGHYDRDVLARFVAGATFAFLEELPPPNDLAVAALSTCAPLDQDLLRLDPVDEVDLGAGSAGNEDH